METIVESLIISGDVDRILAGSPINWSKVPEANKKNVSRILIHCCINGPVSPNRVTTYPTVGEVSLQSLVGEQRISNSGLKRSCHDVAILLENKGYRKGHLYEDRGHHWPLFLEG
jgi:hypothetical protein